MTQTQAEREAGLGETSLSRYENATSSMSVPVAEKLLRLYGVEDVRLEQLLELVRASRRRSKETRFRGIVPLWLEDLVALERDASTIQELALRVVPGYLQTERYARAILNAGLINSESGIEEQVRARMARASILDAAEPPEFWLVLCESALQLHVGGDDVMREQLQHIAEVARRRNVKIQVLPNSHGAHPSMISPFIMLKFAIAPNYTVVYMDYFTGSLYKDDPSEVECYERAYRRLVSQALPTDRSLELIVERAKEI